MAESVLPSHPAPALTGPRVVLRFADKTLSKGTIQGFDPASPTLEFSPLAHREMRREIALRELKAIFFPVCPGARGDQREYEREEWFCTVQHRTS